jgi:AmmeMemoRadiSam system protein B
MFYPASATRLRSEIEGLLDKAERAAQGGRLKALIVPHAGYVYSGPTAAVAYRALQRVAGRIRRVVMLGPAHRVWFEGLALPRAERFATPLGEVAVDAAAVEALRSLPQVVVRDDAHAEEHSLEVQLPFLQAVLGDFTIVPLVVGGAGAADVAEVLEMLWGGDETLLLISSDLSHYLPYDEARRVDRGTVEAILRRDPSIPHQRACGATPIAGLLSVARARDLSPALLDLRNSGDTAGDRDRVVGYAAIAFDERPDE